MKITTLLALLLVSLSPQAFGQECIHDNGLIENISKDIDEDDLPDTDASVEQLLLVNQAANEQLQCLEQLLVETSKQLEQARNEQIKDKVLIDDQANGLDRLEAKVNQLSLAIEEIQTSIKKLTVTVHSNRSDLEEQVATLKNEYQNAEAALQTEIDNLNENMTNSAAFTTKMLGDLERQNRDMNANLAQLSADTSARVSVVDDYVKYLTIAIGAILLLLISLFVYFGIYLQRRWASSNQKVLGRVDEIESSIGACDKKTTEMLELVTSSLNSHKKEEEDHSLALKVADEIVRIEKNISRMDLQTKGLKQLVASIKRIQDNFAANGYEIVEMLNKSYDERMKVSASFVINEDLAQDEQIITKIIKPQVNFKGQMIQAAQIEVSTGE